MRKAVTTALNFVTALLMSLLAQALMHWIAETLLSDADMGLASWEIVFSAITVIPAQMLGGYIAKANFVLPAILLEACILISVFATLENVAGIDGYGMSEAISNKYGVITSLLGAGIGAFAGQRLAAVVIARSA